MRRPRRRHRTDAPARSKRGQFPCAGARARGDSDAAVHRHLRMIRFAAGVARRTPEQVSSNGRSTCAFRSASRRRGLSSRSPSRRPARARRVAVPVPPGCRASNRPDPGGRAVGGARCRGLQQPQRRHLGHERQRQRAAARYALRGRVRLRPEPLAQRPLDRLPHVAVWAFSILVAISLIDQVEVAKLTQAEQSSGEAFAWRPATTPTLPHLSRDAEFVDRPCGAESEQAVHLPAPTCTAIECGAYLTMLTIATFSVCAASFATLANTSAGVACPATSVATRRSAVCSSASSRASRSLAILGGSLS
jgi:hypothetical protein